MPTDETKQLFDKGFELVESGKLAEARVLFEQVCQLDVANAEAWMMRGTVNAELGDTDTGQKDLAKALEINPSLPQAYYYLAIISRNAGNLEEARGHVEKAMDLDPEYREAFVLGTAIYGMLGRTYAQRNDAARSAACYRKVLELKPDAEDAYYGLGYASHLQGRHEEAATHFSRALKQNPAYVDAAISLGTVYQALGRYEDAVTAFNKALGTRPDSAEALFGKARAFVELARQPEAVPLLQQALQIKPDFLEARLNLAAALMTLDLPEEALNHCNKVLELQPGNLDAIIFIARLELQSGQVEVARQRLKPHLVSGIPHINLLITYGDICKSLGCPHDAISGLESLLSGKYNLSTTNRRNIHFCLAQLYDKAGDYDKAFQHYNTGNDLRGVAWDPDTNKSQVDEIIRVFSVDFLAKAPRTTVHSIKPVFIVGMPRSGTSLVEQILASHPAVFGAGELTDLLRMAHGLPAFIGTGTKFPHCATALKQNDLDILAQGYLAHLDALAPDAERVTDKMPGNFSFLGLIQLLFPGARIIHCLRDPLDTCLSCYFQDFAMSQPYSYNLGNLGLFYRDYQRLMAYWKDTLGLPIMEINYEDLVGNQEESSRRLVEYCGLEWDDSCLSFHETQRYVATSSYDQVRRPIYSTSVKRWKNYEKHLGPLREALGM